MRQPSICCNAASAFGYAVWYCTLNFELLEMILLTINKSISQKFIVNKIQLIVNKNILEWEILVLIVNKNISSSSKSMVQYQTTYPIGCITCPPCVYLGLSFPCHFYLDFQYFQIVICPPRKTPLSFLQFTCPFSYYSTWFLGSG